MFLSYFGPFSNQRPFQSLHTRLCNRTSLCLQQRPHTESEVQQGTPSHTSKKKKNSKWCSRHFPKFGCEKMWSLSFPDLNPMVFCGWPLISLQATFVCLHKYFYATVYFILSHYSSFLHEKLLYLGSKWQYVSWRKLNRIFIFTGDING